jgi:indolepyruvate ferredoxin oxidoreductase
MINELVCEGCGDCSVQSNCLAVIPVETPFGRRRQIDPDACNKDFSCLKGFCPSFVTIEGGRRRRPVTPPAPVSPPPPVVAVHERPHALLLAGIGGTGIVTLGAILGTAARMDGLVAVINDVTGMAQKGGPVLGHVQVAARHELIGAERIVHSGADVLLAADLVVANMPDAASRIGTHTRVLANTDVVPTGEFPRDPDARIDAAALTQRLHAKAMQMIAIPALDVCSSLQGTTTSAGMLMLGMVSQRGWLAVQPASVEAAIRLNGVAVEANLAAFAWGRALVTDPERLAALVQVDQTHESLEKYIERRAAFLADYQNDAYADRYRELLLRVRGAETAVAANGEALTRAVAQSAFRLMAYKDEYEVARLHCDAKFRESIASQFEGEYRVHYHLAPPLLARSDPTTGHPVKREFGPWMGRLMPLLARLRGLRGTPLDPFGWTAERRLERALVGEYLSDIESVLTDLSSGRLAQATQLAALPQMIRGYGHIKAASIAIFRTERAKTIHSFGSRL